MRADGRTLFELIYHNTPIYAVDRQPLFCTFCARAQNVSKQSCHLGPSGPNGKIREKMNIHSEKCTSILIILMDFSFYILLLTHPRKICGLYDQNLSNKLKSLGLHF